jgi:hypothetical protein
MSVDFVGGTTPVLDIPVLPYIGVPLVTEAEAGNLADALSQSNVAPKEGDAVLQPAEKTQNILVDEGEILEQEAPAKPELVLDIERIAEISATTAAPGTSVIALEVEAEPSFTYEPIMPGEEGGGYIDVYEPVINVPEGFDPEHHYATEFILDVATGVFTIHLHFSTDPLDYQLAGSAALMSLDGMGQQTIDLGLGDVLPANAPANGSRCTVTITKTTTQNSSSSSFSFKSGVVNYTHNSGGSSVTTTRSYSYEGQLKNGRCVAVNGR